MHCACLNLFIFWFFLGNHVLNGHQGSVRGVCISHDDSFVASSGGDRLIRIWDVESGNCLNIFQGHEKGIYDVCIFHHSNSYVVSGSTDKSVRFWSLDEDN